MREDNSSPVALDEVHRLCPTFRDRACWHEVLIGVSQTAPNHPVGRSLTRYAAWRKLSAPAIRKDPNHDA